MRKTLHDIKILVVLLSVVALTLVMATAHFAQGADRESQTGEDLGKIGAKLANPLGQLYALSMSFYMPQFYDGDANTGDPEVGATLTFFIITRID